MRKTLYFLILFAGAAMNSFAQPTTFPTKEYIDIGNIKAASLVHGDMWWDPVQYNQECEFPKGSGKHIGFTTNLWIAGFDPQNQLHVSAQTYRQSGNDYWPGPIETAAPVSYSKSSEWAKIWKVNKTDIDAFRAKQLHTISNTPASILDWPAKGNLFAKSANNLSLPINGDMAPFIDMNHDGIYNPLVGDYPDIRGDQMLWWVINDDGTTHDECSPNAPGFRFEIHACAYAYHRNTLIDNVIFYQYDIINKSSMAYSNVRLGMRADMDLGFYRDDYLGFDSSRRLAYLYNGRSQDGIGLSNHYDTLIPISGITLLRTPGDIGPIKEPAGSFIFYQNDFTIAGNPRTAEDCNNYMRATWLDGEHLKNDFKGRNINTRGRGSGPEVNYVYSGVPNGDTTQWTECNCNNPVEDRRFVLAGNDFNIGPGQKTVFSFALVAADPDTGQACNNIGKINIRKIQEVTDTAWKHFIPVGIHDVTQEYKQLIVYPNPANDKLYVEVERNVKYEICLYDAMGRKILVPVTHNLKHAELNLSSLPFGLYQVVYLDETGARTRKFIKQ